jgi:hypothetical protein
MPILGIAQSLQASKKSVEKLGLVVGELIHYGFINRKKHSRN